MDDAAAVLMGHAAGEIPRSARTARGGWTGAGDGNRTRNQQLGRLHVV